MRNPGSLGKQSSAWDSAAPRLGPVAVESAKRSCPRIEPALESSWVEFFRRREQNQTDHETPRPRARVAEPGQRSFQQPTAKWDAAIAGANRVLTPFGGQRDRKELSGAACRRSPNGLSRTLEAMPVALAGGAVARANDFDPQPLDVTPLPVSPTPGD
jgi:hypothetical protein